MRRLMLMTKAGRACLRFALVRGADGRQWRKASKLPLICSGLKADPRGDRLCWFGAGPPWWGGPDRMVAELEGQGFWQSRTAYTPEAASNLPS